MIHYKGWGLKGLSSSASHLELVRENWAPPESGRGWALQHHIWSWSGRTGPRLSLEGAEPFSIASGAGQGELDPTWVWKGLSSSASHLELVRESWTPPESGSSQHPPAPPTSFRALYLTFGNKILLHKNLVFKVSINKEDKVKVTGRKVVQSPRKTCVASMSLWGEAAQGLDRLGACIYCRSVCPGAPASMYVSYSQRVETKGPK